MDRLTFEAWLRTVCFQAPTPEAHDLAKCAWEASQSLSQEAVREEALEEAAKVCDALRMEVREQEEYGLPQGQIAMRVASTAVALAAIKVRALKREPNATAKIGQSYEVMGIEQTSAPPAPDVGWREIIAALRRGPEREGFYEKLWKDFGDAQGIIAKVEAYYRERPPSGEMVVVPREDLVRWACWLEDADSRLGPYWLGAKRDTSFKDAADEIRSRLAGTFSCPYCGIATPHQHSIDRKGNVMLSTAEAEGRKT